MHHCALPYSMHFWKSSRTNCPNWTANSRTSGTIFGLCPMADAKLNPCLCWVVVLGQVKPFFWSCWNGLIILILKVVAVWCPVLWHLRLIFSLQCWSPIYGMLGIRKKDRWKLWARAAQDNFEDTERGHREWNLNEVGPCDRDVWRSSVRSTIRAASQLPGKEPTDVEWCSCICMLI